jgi:hypothetical protein
MKVVWLPDFYDAGIAITDDPDNGTFEQFKTMYDVLISLNLPTTRAMWFFEPIEFSGTPQLPIQFYSPLLSDHECCDYCKKLHEAGFEICLHGASSGNNDRTQMLAAIKFIEKEIGKLSVHICHSKNAENLYWDSKCTHSPIVSFLLRFYTKNTCFGEVVGSRYFWGDICKEKIKYIRFYRTRQVNTLAFNPSMPYHESYKPYVNYWFSATKGYLPKLYTQKNLDKLCRENGAGIAYQYMHKYVNSEGSIDAGVLETLERIANDKRIFFRPVSVLLDRLKQFQLLIPILHKGRALLVNASREPVNSVQIRLSKGETVFDDRTQGITMSGSALSIHSINPLSVYHIPVCGARYLTKPVGCIRMFGDIAEIRCASATVIANCSPETIRTDCVAALGRKYPNLKKLDGNMVKVYYKDSDEERLQILKHISGVELCRLFWGQTKILLREHLLMGRKISSIAYLKKPGITEDQSKW